MLQLAGDSAALPITPRAAPIRVARALQISLLAARVHNVITLNLNLSGLREIGGESVSWRFESVQHLTLRWSQSYRAKEPSLTVRCPKLVSMLADGMRTEWLLE